MTISDQAALDLLRNLPGAARVLHEVLAGTNGLRFQWESGHTLDWMNGEWDYFHDPGLESRWRTHERREPEQRLPTSQAGDLGTQKA